jgi:hypothetical protein
MQTQRDVAWSELTADEQARFADEHAAPGQGPDQAWAALPAVQQWRFYAASLDARIAQAPDGVELTTLPLATNPSHRAQHVRYSASRGLCVQRKGRFVEKRRGGKRAGWERRGEEVLIGDQLPTDLADMLVIQEAG